ncbi:MAG: nucleoside 2-deoxyribosyltransferase [Clostridia bacterium]|nr:nucleoside 2-deoxyribosyltransferase [Clostridia bacterium]
MNNVRIYIAGPSVFMPDAEEYSRKIKALCAEYGFKGVYPTDGFTKTPRDIYLGCLKLIDSCDVIIADGNPFRGEIDSGTAFELGYASARGKRLYIYMDDASSVKEKYSVREEDGVCYDENGNIVEDYGYPLNLMLACSSIIVEGGFEDVLKKLSGRIKADRALENARTITLGLNNDEEASQEK